MTTDTLIKYMRADMRVLIVGPPGTGKTAKIAAAAEACGRELVVIRASLSERVDLGGALVPDQDAGVTRELPLASLKHMQEADKPTLLLLDDLGQAPIDVQAACMRLFDAGYLSDNVLIWGATNRPGDKAGVSALCEPLRSRFDMAFSAPLPPQPDTKAKVKRVEAAATQPLGSWQEELDGWCAWALDNNAAPEIVAWHRSTTGRTLHQWEPCADPAVRMADYRSWHTCIRLFDAGITDMASLSAVIGAPAAVEFCAFTALTDKTPTVEDIVKEPGKCKVPSDPGALWLVATACGAAMTQDNIGPMLQYLQRLPRIYCALAVRDGYRRAGTELARTPEWRAWFVENKDIFR